YHVPFDELTDTTSVEARLGEAVRSGERVAVMGDSGAGKSSLVSHVLGPMAEGVAPLVVPVRTLDRDAARPERVADELLATVPHYLERIGRLGDTDMLAGATRHVTAREDYSGGLRLALPWLQGELARDLGRQVEVDLPIPLGAKADALRAAFDRIARDGLQPIIVFDDTDRWLGTSDEATVEGFFTESLRWLTDLPVSVVVATHHAYVPDHETRRRRLAFVPTRIDIPPLPGSGALAEVLARRVDRNCVDTPFAGSGTSDVFEDEALGALLQDYPAPDSLRQVMLLGYASVRFAINEEAERVTADHVAAARDGF
ncbi:MAG: hypothetical protein PVH07_10165, partial [Chloroflexota bacterium]